MASCLNNVCNTTYTECQPIASTVQYKCCCTQNADICFNASQLFDAKHAASPYPPDYETVCGGHGPIADELRTALLVLNSICFLAALFMAAVVRRKRNAQQQYGVRGWALMELFLIGAAILYSIVILEYVHPARLQICALVVWARELGFAVFYGAVILKIYRNLIEYRVRKAHHVYVKEKDMLKYLTSLIVLTVTGLAAWTLGWAQLLTNRSRAEAESVLVKHMAHTWHTPPYQLCRVHLWSYAWQCYEMVFLMYGLWLCYKARNTTWVERWQFTLAVSLEMFVSLTVTLIRILVWRDAHPDTQMLVSFVQVHVTVTVNIVVITLPKFYYISLDYHPDQSVASRTTGKGQSGTLQTGPGGIGGKLNPAGRQPWHQIRDKLENGTIDFAVVPIHEMNHEDIRAELKRIYTQLRMYKMKNMYQDNPHISKRKGGKKSSDKELRCKTTRRTSNLSPSLNPKTKEKLSKVDDEEQSCALVSQTGAGLPASVTVSADCASGSSLAYTCTVVPPPAVVVTADHPIGRLATELTASNNDLTVESSPSNIWLSNRLNSSEVGVASCCTTAGCTTAGQVVTVSGPHGTGTGVHCTGTATVHTSARQSSPTASDTQQQRFTIETANSVRV